jgi:hypothetical protein
MLRMVILFLFLPALLYSQKKVGDVLVNQKAYADSFMRVQYGEDFFNRYFVFDYESGGYLGVGHHQWNENTNSDTASYYYLWYFFHFPGSMADTTIYAEFRGDKTEKPTRTLYCQKYPGVCINLDSSQLDTIAHKIFNHPLRVCTVRLYEFGDFEDSLFFVLDSSHVFLEVEYDSIVYYRRNKRYKLWRHKLVVDACSSDVVLKNFLYVKGSVAGPFMCGAGVRRD